MVARRSPLWVSKLIVNRDGASQRGVVDELRRVIVDGVVPPGAQIPVNEVATVFGVSAIPVRESLKTLTAEGLVTHQTNIATPSHN